MNVSCHSPCAHSYNQHIIQHVHSVTPLTKYIKFFLHSYSGDCFHWPLPVPGYRYVLSPTRKETCSEACQGRARFQQHRDASCHRIFCFLQGNAPREIHAILTETLASFLPGRAKDLSAHQYIFSSESFNSTYFVRPHGSPGLMNVSLCFCSCKYLPFVEHFQICFSYRTCP